MPLEIGADFDRYRLEALVGQGGMGRIYRAFDARLHRWVALKILDPTRTGRAIDAAGSVLREARAAAALDHPGVVAIFDVGEAEGHPFIAMEYIVGRSLRALIGAHEVPHGERLRWLVDVARSLAAAHRAGLVHRDIKPENVMLREDGAVKLLDFGIARATGAAEPGIASEAGPRATIAPESSLVGTPCYMAPEQVQRLPVDARADQFGWGVLAHEVLTGALPWRSIADGVPVAVAVVTERHETVDAAALGLPARVAEVLDRALEKSPERRFATMDALLDALEGDAPRRDGAIARASAAGPGEATLVPAAATSMTTDAGRTRAHRRLAARIGGALALLAGGLVGLPALFPADPAAPAADAAELAAWQPNEPARAAFQDGLRRVRNAALNFGIERFEEAIEYEPEYAAAHLRVAFVTLMDGPYPAPAEPFHAARRLHRRLDARERALLDALAPAFEREAPDPDAVTRRLGALAERFPDDDEFPLYHALALAWQSRDVEASAGLQRLIARDPTSASPWYVLAYITARTNDFGAAHAALARCLELAPDAVDCLWLRLKLHAHTGRCAAMHEDARRWQALKASDHSPAIARVHALIALGSPADAIDAAEDDAATAMSVTLHTVSARFNESSRRILAGDFATADRILERLPVEAGFSYDDRLRLVELRVALHEEIGDLAGAAAIARELRLRKGSLPGGAHLLDDGILADPTPTLDAVLARTGELDHGDRLARREAWLADWRRRGAVQHERELWLRGFAAPARTREDAREASAVLDTIGSLRRFVGDHLLVVDAGRVLLLAGRAEEAIPLLREAAQSCMAALEPIRFVQAHALLGQALEATGERARACEAYAGVLQRWEGARPRSLTAEDVASRAAALGCAPAGHR